MDLIQKALIKAYDLHKHQTRKMSSTPYLVHLLDAAKYLMYETDDEEIICAGILHDALEDTSYSEKDLKKDFGERVYLLVKFCTEPGNNHDSSSEELKDSWKERKTRAINKLENASDEELLIFCADKISNLSSMKEDLVFGIDVWSKFNGSRSEVEWYYCEIEKVLKRRLGNRRIFSVYKDLMGLFSSN